MLFLTFRVNTITSLSR